MANPLITHCRRFNLSYILIILACLLIGFPAFSAQAKSATAAFKPTDSSRSAIIVPASENVDSVLSVGHPVIVRGAVTNTILAIDADIWLEPGSHVALVLALGGRVQQLPGAKVSEGVIALGRAQPVLTTLALTAALSASLYLLWAFVTASVFVFASLVGILLRNYDHAVSANARAHWLHLVGGGALWTAVPTLLTFASLLAAQLWVVTAVCTLLLLVLGLIGLPFAANTLGRSLTHWLPGPAARFPSVYGALGIAVSISVPILGLFAVLALWFFCVGLTVSILRRPRQLQRTSG